VLENIQRIGTATHTTILQLGMTALLNVGREIIKKLPRETLFQEYTHSHTILKETEIIRKT